MEPGDAVSALEAALRFPFRATAGPESCTVVRLISDFYKSWQPAL
jgi:hypothetical protein